ncbi:MAG TPA: hypothetical protein PK594_14650, partial [Mycobacterium sp.]|nr:hypothetical protein [Mycobacterium sp.]
GDRGFLWRGEVRLPRVLATMPYVIKLAEKGWQGACFNDPALARGLSTHQGQLLNAEVAHDLDLPYTDPVSLLA